MQAEAAAKNIYKCKKKKNEKKDANYLFNIAIPERNSHSETEISQSQPTYEPRIEPTPQWWEARMMPASVPT